MLAAAIAITAWLLPGIHIDWHPGIVLWIAVVLATVNLFLGSILRLLSLPITVLTLGLFGIVINALMLLVTDWLIDSFDVDGLLAALGGAVVISVVGTLLGLVTRQL